MADNNHDKEKKPVYKKWWFWVIIVLVLAIAGAGSNLNKSSNNNDNGDTATINSEPTNYVGQDAKIAYDELTKAGYSIKFLFDRKNNGGFSDDDFQKYVIDDSFGSSDYANNPFSVTKQETLGKQVNLSIDYKAIIDQDNAQKEKEAKLEGKLHIVESETACDQYGKRNYQNFKRHSIVGEIAEYASDDNTWFIKYYVDANGYKNLTMECYVTGTTDNPQVTKFTIY